jgi:hypothetical protein
MRIDVLAAEYLVLVDMLSQILKVFVISHHVRPPWTQSGVLVPRRAITALHLEIGIL